MGKRKDVEASTGSSDDCYEHVLSTLRGSEDGSSMKVKSLRKLVLLALQTDEDDKDGKKRFKKTVKTLEDEGKVSLDADGLVTLSKSERKKHKKKKKKRKIKTKIESDDENENDETNAPSSSPSATETDRKAPCPGNPNGTTRLFMGNLPFKVDEASLSEFCAPAELTHVKWITDKETGRFYGSAFVEAADSRAAAAILKLNGQELGGRPVRTNLAPAREGDEWPPKERVVTGGSGGGGGGGGGERKDRHEIKELPPQPPGCVKLFLGNLSYEIDDDGIFKFFAAVDAEVRAIRWIHHKDSGDFKGVGFAEFWNEEACAKAATLNGKKLLGRPIRIDWTD